MQSFSFRTSLASISRVAAICLLTSSAAGVFAQQTADAAPSANLDLSHPVLSLQASLKSPLPPIPAEASSSSSSSAGLPAAPAAELSAGADLQPPPRRRRYGRPNYSDKYRNADGSNRLAFNVGGGFNLPVGSASSNYLNTSYRFQAGGGINLSSKLAVIAQFDYDHFGLPGSVLANQQNLYTVVGDPSQTQNGSFAGLGGSSHIWSLTLNPTINFYQGETIGAYAVAGGGYYHKVTDFTVPSVGQYCDYYGYCYQYQTNQIIDHYTSNSPGVNGGIGLTYKFSRWGNQRLFAEARFVHTFNKARLADSTLPNQPPGGTPYNLYPPNSNETSYIPITFGIRF